MNMCQNVFCCSDPVKCPIDYYIQLLQVKSWCVCVPLFSLTDWNIGDFIPLGMQSVGMLDYNCGLDLEPWSGDRGLPSSVGGFCLCCDQPFVIGSYCSTDDY